MKFFFGLVFSTILLLLPGVGSSSIWALPAQRKVYRSAHTLKQVWRIVKTNVYDASIIRTFFTQGSYHHLQNEIKKAKSLADFARVVNTFFDGISVLGTSFLTNEDPLFYLVHSYGISSRPYVNPIWHIGMITKRKGSQHIISGLLEGYPGMKAGLQRGDILLQVNGKPFHPITSFCCGSLVRVKVQRRQTNMVVFLRPVREWLHNSLLQAQYNSLKIIQSGQKKFGYIHVWTTTGVQAVQTLKRLMSHGKLSGIDGLIVDLRGGFGDFQYMYWHSYLAFFLQHRKNYVPLFLVDQLKRKKKVISPSSLFKPIDNHEHSPLCDKDTYYPPFLLTPKLLAQIKELKKRYCNIHRFRGSRTPLVLLINKETQGFKELLALQLKVAHRAFLIGEATAGVWIKQQVYLAKARRFSLVVGTHKVLFSSLLLRMARVTPHLVQKKSIVQRGVRFLLKQTSQKR